MSLLQTALEYDRLGWNILDCPSGTKTPIRAWRRFRTDSTSPYIQQWFSGRDPGDLNLFLICGMVSGVVVLDCDSDEAEQQWRDRLGAILDRTARARTSRGWHYYFRIDQPVRSTKGPGWDLKADGGGVILPPSLHPSGFVYQWDRHPADGMEMLPAELTGPYPSPSGPGSIPERIGTSTRSMLAQLLRHPPDPGGRNDWLAKVCGHYAKLFHHTRDAYDANIQMAADQIKPPLSEQEVSKTANSIWDTEHQNNPARQATEDTGWLVGNGERIQCQTRLEGQIGLATWADFDIQALGQIGDGTDGFSYLVRLTTNNCSFDAVMPVDVFTSPSTLRRWLAQFQATVTPPDHIWPRSGGVAERLIRYLKSQGAVAYQPVAALGWDETEQGFITNQGVIGVDGPREWGKVRPLPRVGGWSAHRYGFGSQEQAVQILREVLTFHDETVCSVFGSWWAACLLKPQIQRRVAGFPFMAIESPSETGKTTGFFNLMVQLNGSTSGPQVMTPAALRDALSANRSGIVWIDDLNDPIHLHELLRQVTVGGTMTKKAEDRSSQVSAQAVAPLVVSGEGLGLQGQKALADRSVQLHVPSPIGRRSLHGDYPQWEDIVNLRARHPDLTVFAGNMVMTALRSVDEIETLKNESGGRFGDNLAVVLFGARVLARMTGDSEHIARVTRWCGEQADIGSENALTFTVVPAALTRLGFPDKPSEPTEWQVATPAFVQDEVVWVSPRLLADWWRQNNRGSDPAGTRLFSQQALEGQLRALGVWAPGRLGGVQPKRFKLVPSRRSKIAYWPLPDAVGRAVLARAEGRSMVAGVVPEQVRLELEASVLGPSA